GSSAGTDGAAGAILVCEVAFLGGGVVLAERRWPAITSTARIGISHTLPNILSKFSITALIRTTGARAVDQTSRDHSAREHLVHHRTGDLVEEHLPHLRIALQKSDDLLLLRRRRLAPILPQLLAGRGLVFLDDLVRDHVHDRILRVRNARGSQRGDREEVDLLAHERLLKVDGKKQICPTRTARARGTRGLLAMFCGECQPALKEPSRYRERRTLVIGLTICFADGGTGKLNLRFGFPFDKSVPCTRCGRAAHASQRLTMPRYASAAPNPPNSNSPISSSMRR